MIEGVLDEVKLLIHHQDPRLLVVHDGNPERPLLAHDRRKVGRTLTYGNTKATFRTLVEDMPRLETSHDL